MSLACATCPVRDRAACSVLSEADRDKLSRSGRHVDLKRGDTLFHAGDEGNSCATLLTGALKVTRIDSEGNERILALIHPAGFIGELFRPFADYDVVALGESRLCLFGRGDMENALDQHPALARALLRRAQEDLHASRELLAMAGKNSAEEKIATLILALAQAASDSPCHPAQRFELPLTRGEIANLLGVTIETVSRQLSRLEKAGVIVKNGSRGIEIVDPARLRLMSDLSA